MTKKYPVPGNERAVSPVVGVMLMLVVTIAIAATVSGFSGSLMGETAKKAPTLSMDVKVVNTGTWHGSGFFATVTSVSDPIPTKNLEIVTSWSETTAATGSLYSLSSFAGGNTTMPGVRNINVLFDPSTQVNGNYTSPFGTGPGVNGTEGVDVLKDYTLPMQQFGNYSLVAGTTMVAFPCGAADSYNFTSSSGVSATSGGYGTGTLFRYSNAYSDTQGNLVDKGWPDAATAVLGTNWTRLKWGNSVNVKVIHIPTGKVIFNQDVPVTES